VVAAIDGDYEPMIEHARSLGGAAMPKKASAKKVGSKAAAQPTATTAKKAPKTVKAAVPKKKVPAVKAPTVVAKKTVPMKATNVPSKKTPPKKALAASVPRDRFASIVGTLGADIKGRP
jgi:hypothetical protein